MIKRKEVIVKDYDPNWSECFAKLKQVFEQYLGDLILAVEHVGSTSVEGLAAKPIIDLDLIVEDDGRNLSPVIEKLAELGYIHRGDLGIAGREAFKRNSAKVPFDNSDREWMNHHLYVCKRNSASLLNYLKLRDYLRENVEARIEYGKIKKDLAKKYPFAIDSYIEGKTAFILKILKALDFDDSDLQNIKNQNKAE